MHWILLLRLADPQARGVIGSGGHGLAERVWTAAARRRLSCTPTTVQRGQKDREPLIPSTLQPKRGRVPAVHGSPACPPLPIAPPAKAFLACRRRTSVKSGATK